MPQPYSLDLCERVVVAAAHQTQAEVAARFAVSESTVYKWCRRARETGSPAAKPHTGGGHPTIDAAGGELLTALVGEQNDRTLAELAALYGQRTGVGVSIHAIHRACGRLDLRRKKRSLGPAEQAREDVAAARAAWAAAQAQVAPEDWVFVDESGVATAMARRYGPALRPGAGRAAGARDGALWEVYGKWERLTIFGGLSLPGLVACMSVAGAADTAAVVAFVRHVLVPVLRPGQVVVMDNLTPHKAPLVRALIEAAGCRLLFLPPYSPDFDPIEPAWAKRKALLRGLGARTLGALEAALTTLVDAITAADAAGFFRHSGYAVQ